VRARFFAAEPGHQWAVFVGSNRANNTSRTTPGGIKLVEFVAPEQLPYGTSWRLTEICEKVLSPRLLRPAPSRAQSHGGNSTSTNANMPALNDGLVGVGCIVL
jgi:hypothetical protein